MVEVGNRLERNDSDAVPVDPAKVERSWLARERQPQRIIIRHVQGSWLPGKSGRRRTRGEAADIAFEGRRLWVKRRPPHTTCSGSTARETTTAARLAIQETRMK